MLIHFNKKKIAAAINALQRIAIALETLCVPNPVVPKPEITQANGIKGRKKGARTGFVRPDNLARKIARETGQNPKVICKQLWSQFGDKLVSYDGSRKGFPKSVEHSIFVLMTNK